MHILALLTLRSRLNTAELRNGTKKHCCKYSTVAGKRGQWQGSWRKGAIVTKCRRSGPWSPHPYYFSLLQTVSPDEDRLLTHDMVCSSYLRILDSAFRLSYQHVFNSSLRNWLNGQTSNESPKFLEKNTSSTSHHWSANPKPLFTWTKTRSTETTSRQCLISCTEAIPAWSQSIRIVLQFIFQEETALWHWLQSLHVISFTQKLDVFVYNRAHYKLEQTLYTEGTCLKSPSSCAVLLPSTLASTNTLPSILESFSVFLLIQILQWTEDITVTLIRGRVTSCPHLL